MCVGALAEGAIAGKPVRRYLYLITSHDEAWAKWGVQGTAWQTGAAAACAVTQFARDEDRPAGYPRRGRPAGGLSRETGGGEPPAPGSPPPARALS